MGHLVKFIPIKELRRLTIKWPQLPNTAKTMWDAGPFEFINYAVAHEGENSLLSELIK